MSSIIFDTLSSAKRLCQKGVSQEQAEAFAEELCIASEIDVSHLGTREELNTFKSELKADLQMLELRLKLQIGTMIFALGGVLITVKYFGHS